MLGWVFNDHCVCNDPFGDSLFDDVNEWVSRKQRSPDRFLTLTLYDQNNREWYLTGGYDDSFIMDAHIASEDTNDWIRTLRLKFLNPVVTDFYSVHDASFIMFEFDSVEMVTNAEELADYPVMFHLLWRPTTSETIYPYQWMYPQMPPEKVTWAKDGF